MPRKNGSVEKRDVLPDPIYQSKLVTRLINRIRVDGKKGVAQDILYGAFKKVNNQKLYKQINSTLDYARSSLKAFA